MSRPLLFVAADRRELTGWVAHWSRSSPAALPVQWARAGTWRGADVLAVANGAGPRQAFAAVMAVENPSMVCNVGFCGALDSSLRIGDVVLASEVRDGARSYAVRQPTGPAARSGTVVSIPRIAATAAGKGQLRDEGGFVVEMEAAGVARASEEIDVPFFCVRAVSDLANESFVNDFNGALMPDGRFSVARLLLGALGSPVARFGELIRLSRRTALASVKLGDYLADCTF